MWNGATVSFVFLIVLLISLSERFQTCNGGQNKEALETTEGCNGWAKSVNCIPGMKRKPKPDDEPFILEETNKIIERVGYISETVTLDVEIGNENKNTFKLKLFRVKEPKTLDVKNKPAVLLMHGSMSSSSDFVFGEKQSGLGFYLADNGFDVWLGNFRGNVFAGLDIKNNSFWDFSFHEMGMYDIPAQIDYILKETGQEKLYFIGYSMGTTAAYVMLSSRPEYNDKIERMISLAPVVFIDRSIFGLFESTLIGFHGLIEKLKPKNRKSYWRGPVKFYKTPKCFREKWKNYCESGINGQSSTDKSLMNPELREKFFRVMPVGCSVKTLAHYFRMIRSGQFKPMTYVKNGTILEYVNDEAPPYKLESVTVPTLMLLARMDAFTIEKTIDYLMGNLTGIPRDLLLKKFVDHQRFDHLDFILAKSLSHLVFKPVVNYLKTGQP